MNKRTNIDRATLISGFCSKLGIGPNDNDMDAAKLRELIITTADEIEDHVIRLLKAHGKAYFLNYQLPPKQIVEIIEQRIVCLFPSIKA